MKLSESVVKIAAAELGVREVPRNSNCGPRVNVYKAATWLDHTKPWPWCAAFVDFCVWQAMQQCGVKETKTFKRPQTAGAWDLINWSLKQDDTTTTARRPKASQIASGDIVVFDFDGAGHVGFATGPCDASGRFPTIEGNTDEAGSREGGGVYRKTRNVSTVKARIRLNI